MIDRTYIQIDGPPGAGKTSLIERLLESNRSKWILTARFKHARSLRRPTETSPGNMETRRYAMAGAQGTLLYEYPPEGIGQAARSFWDTTFIKNESDGVVFEAAGDLNLNPDLTVYVTRPLPEGQRLITRGKKVVGRLGLETYLKLVRGEEDTRQDKVTEEEAEPPLDEETIETEETFEIPDELAWKLIDYAERGVPLHQDSWLLRESHAGLVRARVVVINIHGEADRPAAERLAGEVRRIYEDEEVAKDLRPQRRGRRAVSLFIANLADPQDNQLRKALARIKKVFIRR